MMETSGQTRFGRFKNIFNSDKVIPIVVIFLTGVSILMVYSMRGEVVLQHLKHLLFAYGGMIFFYLFNYERLGKYAPLLIVLAAILLVATLGSSAVRGITIMGRDVQTFYMIGFVLILFMSYVIGRCHKHSYDEWKKTNRSTPDVEYKFLLEGSVPWILYVVLGGFCLMIAVLNMSTAIILFITGIAILFAGGAKIKDLSIMIGIVAAVLLVAVVIVANLSEEKKAGVGRVATFINRWEYFITNDNTNGYGDQMILARTAIARSGFHPAGPGNGVVKNRLPEKETDYAFASLFEETGIVVGFLVIFSYMIIFYRAREISKKADGYFGKLLAFGIGFWFTVQALVHIGVNCELLPATGQTLPFISSGGSSLAVSGCAMGILLNIGRKIERDSNKRIAINITKD